jgi:hypothetical protein
MAITWLIIKQPIVPITGLAFYNIIHITILLSIVTLLRWRSSSQVLPIQWAMAIRIDYQPAGDLFLTQTTLTDQVSYRSPNQLFR